MLPVELFQDACSPVSPVLPIEWKFNLVSSSSLSLSLCVHAVVCSGGEVYRREEDETPLDASGLSKLNDQSINGMHMSRP